jgi:hypothetical protein
MSALLKTLGKILFIAIFLGAGFPKITDPAERSKMGGYTVYSYGNLLKLVNTTRIDFYINFLAYKDLLN